MREDFIYFLCGFLGMTVQFLQGLQSLKQTAKAANFTFVFKKYLQDDIIVILTTIATIFLFILFLPNFLQIRPDSIKIARIVFGLVGWTGSDILQLVFSPTKKKIMDIIDIKTNIADNKTQTT